MANMIHDLKVLHGNIIGSNGNLLTKDQHVKYMLSKIIPFTNAKAYPNYKITDRQYELMLGIMHLVMNTKITSKNTKNYLGSNAVSVRRFVESYNLVVSEDGQLKAASVSQNVDYDRKKLLNFFPDDIISQIRYFGWEERIAGYEKMLDMAYVKYGGNRKMLNNLALTIPKTAVNDNLSEKEFKELLIVISKYTKNHMKFISENLPIEQVGYLNYLVSAHKLQGEDLKRAKYLKVLLEGEEFIELGEIDSTEQEEDIEPDENETTIEDKEQVKGGIRETVVTKAGGLKSTRIQYDPNLINKDGIEDEIDINLEDIDFGDTTDADVE
jgi:hypothetical protein